MQATRNALSRLVPGLGVGVLACMLLGAMPLVSYGQVGNERFEEQYNAVVTMRESGDAVAALDALQELVAEREPVEKPLNSAAQHQMLSMRALEANLLRDLNRNDESLAKHKVLLEVTQRETTVE